MSVETYTPQRRPAAKRSPKTCPTCTSCPVCGTEECFFLEELGTYCATMAAAQLGVGDDLPPSARDAGQAA